MFASDLTFSVELVAQFATFMLGNILYQLLYDTKTLFSF